MIGSSPVVDDEARAAVIDELLRRLREHYVFPEVAGRIEKDVRGRAGNHEYDELHDAGRLCEALTAHMQEVSHDKHLRLFFRTEPRPKPGDEEDGRKDPERHEELRLAGELENFGFRRVERLPGNVGYLDLREFHAPEFGAETAVAAMNLLSNTGALIVDLRENGGGHPAMVALLCSYFFGPDPVHLNDLYWRAEDTTQQFWTLPHVPGRRYVDKPVYVLTGGGTFSGAEEFAYNLKNLGRATIIGETTKGGAHPVDRYWLDAHFHASIPVGRAINPVTGTNWEGTGVIPDVEVPQESALEVAQRAALKEIIAGLGDDPRGPRKALQEEAEQALAGLDAV